MTQAGAMGVVLAVGAAIQGAAQTAVDLYPVRLKLTVHAEAVHKNIPQVFTVLLTNQGERDVHLPMPATECADALYGTLWLRLNFVPVKPGPPSTERVCFSDYFYQPILDRVQKWKVIRPGESLAIRRINDLVIGGEAGTYDYWAYYYPPGMPKADEDLLRARGIDFPKEEQESAHVKFVKK